MKFWCVIATGAALFSAPVLAQGDDCTTATPLFGAGTGVVQTTPISTVGFNLPGPAPCTGFGGAEDGVWSFTPSLTGSATFSVCQFSTIAPGASLAGGFLDTTLAVYDASSCPIGGALIACADGSPNCGVNQSEVTFPVTAGVTYYVLLSDWTGSGDTYTGTLAYVENGTPGVPANDTPAGATVLFGTGAFPVTTPDDNSGSAVDGPLPSCGIPSKDLWYYYVPSCNGLATITACSGSGSGTGGLGSMGDSVISAFVDAGGFPGGELACNDDSCSTTGLASTISIPVTGGVPIYVSVSGFNGSSGTFTLEITENCSFSIQPGDDCTVAVAQFGPGVVPYNATGFAIAGPAAFCSATSGDVFDFWIEYTATSNGVLVASNCPSSVNAPGGSGSPSDTYIAIWDGSTCPPTLILNCADGSPNCGIAESEALASVVAGNVYYVQVGTWLGGVANIGAVSLTELLPPPNDECIGAVALSPGTNGPFDNSLATPSVPNGSCAFGGSDTDLWFSYTAPCAGSLIVNTCGTSLDTWLSVWDGCPSGGGVELACNDDAASGPCMFTLQSYIELPVTAGNTYYINVGGWNGQTGQFNINLSCKYVHSWTVPAGPNSIQLENVDGPPFSLPYSAITLDVVHPGLAPAVTFPNGWFYGVPMGLVELITQLTWPGGAPFLVPLDGAGYSLNFSAPAGTTSGLIGATIWSVGAAFDPATGFATILDVTDPTAFVIT